jgi:hypothetical protein
MTFTTNKIEKESQEIQVQGTETQRVIGHLKSATPGPTVVFFGGIHGNEPSGVFALRQDFKELESRKEQLRGEFIGLGGNLWALARNQRFFKQDLNRMWTQKRMARIGSPDFVPDPRHRDEREQLEIHRFLQKLLASHQPPFFFLDLHTTSSHSIPFLTVNDTLVNRGFATHFPVPIILGIEEYLDGPLLSYINELGYIALGFEAGQHDDPVSVLNHRAFIYLTLIQAGSLPMPAASEYQELCDQLKRSALGSRAIYEIRYRYEVSEDEDFEMLPGFQNFQVVHKGEKLACTDQVCIESDRNGKIFMPLYQKLGNDGFFLIRQIPRLALQISAWIRKWNLDRFLPLLPGVRRHPEESHALIVNQRVARFFARDFFHLFGYRSKQLDQDHIVMRNRETRSRYWEYKSEED